MAAPPPDIETLCRPGKPCGLSFLVALGNAPFPVGADARDQRGDPFWHGVDAETGARWRKPGERRYTEAEAYADSRVLFHIPPRFDPAKPFHIVLFLHGHFSTLTGTLVDGYDLPGQIDRSGANAVLVAPQLARDAQDSAPGKFVEPGRVAAFLDEAEAVLRHTAGGDAAAWRAAPLIVAAYSGGYRTAAQVLIKGGVDARIAGLLMLDAFYADADFYARWLQAHHHRAFLHALFTESSEKATEALKESLRARDIAYAVEDDGGPMAGIRFLRVATPHAEVPRLGPPVDPLADMLRRLPPPLDVLPLPE